MALLLRNHFAQKQDDLHLDDVQSMAPDFKSSFSSSEDLSSFSSTWDQANPLNDLGGEDYSHLLSQYSTPTKIQIDKDGFVELVDWMGNDLSVVNAARVSYNRESTEFNERDEKLLKYLWTNHHTSPFRHTFLSFKVRLPIFVLRQWQKHEIGCAWRFDLNEQSGRYTELKHGYFRPDTWRLQDTKNKQSSFGSLSIEDSQKASTLLDFAYFTMDQVYHQLLEMGVAKEQARIVLPVSTYTECIWTGSLQAIMHFLTLRTKPSAQYETRMYAEGIAQLTKTKFPKSMELVEQAIKQSEN